MDTLVLEQMLIELRMPAYYRQGALLPFATIMAL